MQTLLKTLERIVNAILDAINRSKKKDASDNPANTIANGGRVRKSEKSFEELAREFERDRIE